MHLKDLQDQLAKIESRYLEARVGSKEAALAQARITECNQRIAQMKKEEVSPSVTS